MRLFRFAIISIVGAADDWQKMSLRRGGALVRVMSATCDANGVALFVCSDVQLSEFPTADEDRTVEIPDRPRRLTEKAIDAAANLIAVATGHARSVTSQNLPLAFYAESDEDREFLRAQAGIKGLDRGVGFGRMSVRVTAENAKALRDRESGIALLAEALSQDHFGGRYRELLRVFEAAFAESDNKLVVMLAEFLARRPRLGYTKTEVKRWVTGRRGRAVHADRSAPLVGADLGDVVDRMLLAAYEVLFNKTNWHSYDAARRDAWTPAEGPLDASGGWFVRQHETPLMQAQFYDPYGVYPLNLAAHGLRLGDDNFWPSSGPLRTTVNQGQVSVIPAAELAIISGD